MLHSKLFYRLQEITVSFELILQEALVLSWEQSVKKTVILVHATGLEKVSFHPTSKERQCQRMLKLLHSCTHLHVSKVMLKILEARLQQYVN